jgi:hypothetical protein
MAPQVLLTLGIMLRDKSEKVILQFPIVEPVADATKGANEGLLT